MTTTGYINRLADELDWPGVLCAAVIVRAVEDATTRPGKANGVALHDHLEARNWIASDALLNWLTPLVPATADVDEVAARVRAMVAERGGAPTWFQPEMIERLADADERPRRELPAASPHRRKRSAA